MIASIPRERDVRSVIRAGSKNIQHVLRRTANGGAIALEDYGTLDQLWMRGQRGDQRVIVVGFGQAKLLEQCLSGTGDINGAEAQRFKRRSDVTGAGGIIQIGADRNLFATLFPAGPVSGGISSSAGCARWLS